MNILVIDCSLPDRCMSMMSAFASINECNIHCVVRNDDLLVIKDHQYLPCDEMHFDLVMVHAREKDKIDILHNRDPGPISVKSIIYYGGIGKNDPDVSEDSDVIVRPIINDNYLSDNEAEEIINYITEKNKGKPVMTKPPVIGGETMLDKKLILLHLCLSPEGARSTQGIELASLLNVSEQVRELANMKTVPFDNQYIAKLSAMRDILLEG